MVFKIFYLTDVDTDLQNARSNLVDAYKKVN